MDSESGLPVVSTAQCTACGACVKVCPKGLFEIRKTNKKDIKIFVACSNCDKGAVARKACANACIGCAKCQKACEYNAISIKHNCAYIDASLCKLCRKCVSQCPTNAIVTTNCVAPLQK
jgi:Fe-S-cluster-containing hydrogenase component 2